MVWHILDDVDANKFPVWVVAIVHTMWHLIEITSWCLISYLIYIRYKIFMDPDRKTKIIQSLIIAFTVSPLVIRIFFNMYGYARGDNWKTISSRPAYSILKYIGSILNILYKLYYDWYFLLMFTPFLKDRTSSSGPLIKFQYYSYLIEIVFIFLYIIFLVLQLTWTDLLSYIDPSKLVVAYAMLNMVDLKHMTVAVLRSKDHSPLRVEGASMSAMINTSDESYQAKQSSVMMSCYQDSMQGI